MKTNSRKKGTINSFSIVTMIGFISSFLGLLTISISVSNGVTENFHAFIYGVFALLSGYYSIKSNDSETNFKKALILHIITFIVLCIELSQGMTNGTFAAIHFVMLIVIGNYKKKLDEAKEVEGLSSDIKLCRHCKSQMPKKANVCTACKRRQQNIFLVLLKIYLTFCVIVFLVSYGEENMSDSNKHETGKNIENNTEIDKNIEDTIENNKNELTESDDNIIDTDIKDCHLKYVSHKIENNLAGDKCVVVFYEFTNNSSENKAFGYCIDAKAFQNGIELESSLFYAEDDEKTDYAEIKPGVTVKVCESYELRDDSEVTLEISRSFSDNIVDSMIVQVK